MLPPAILALAARGPAGLFDNRSVARAGYSSLQLTRWVRAGLVERLAPGWYRIAGRPVDRRQHLHLAPCYLSRRQRNCLTDGIAPFASLLTGREIAAEYGCSAPPEDHGRALALIDVSRQVRLAGTPFDVLRTDLSVERCHEAHGLLLASPARVLSDVAETAIGDAELRTCVDDLRRVGALDIFAAIQEWAGCLRPGCVRLAAMARRGDFEQESEAERALFRDVLCAYGPAPDCQVWVTPRIRVDFAWWTSAMIVEYHGVGPHRERVDEDAARAWELRRLDLDVLVVTKSMTRDPEGLGRWIHDVRGRRADDVRAGRLPRPPAPLMRRRLVPFRTV